MANPLTGELDLDAALDEMYRPNGRRCEFGGCQHTSINIYQLYGPDRRGGRTFLFLCECCLMLKKLERAEWWVKQIPRLMTEYDAAKVKCKRPDQ